MATFTVDTHLFRELGELLVGRDSTALIELIKNCYDADATRVVVYGEALKNLSRGFIQIQDNGIGMSRSEFEQGFLRIASRSKDTRERRSKLFGRRYTGAKGIGRLAAHKLARTLQVTSSRWNGAPLPSKQVPNTLAAEEPSIEASIDWDIVESKQTLDELERTNAISIGEVVKGQGMSAGTIVTLRRLRKAWTARDQGRFMEELQTFQAPPSLTNPIPRQFVESTLLFDQPRIRDVQSGSGSQFLVQLEGELSPPDDYWIAILQAANWVIEIHADRSTKQVRYAIAPTATTLADLPESSVRRFMLPHPAPNNGPFFQARILKRTGRMRGSDDLQQWAGRSSGIRVFMEGFRVLPYGEMGDDWLQLDRDTAERQRWTLAEREPKAIAEQLNEAERDPEAGLGHLPNKHYFGAVFLTERDAPTLRMLVNREGFIPDAAYLELVQLVRKGIDLSTRVQAAATHRQRAQRSSKRQAPGASVQNDTPVEAVMPAARAIQSTVGEAKAHAGKARQLVASGNVAAATQEFRAALSQVEQIASLSQEVAEESAMVRVLASVGTQLASFIHEINGLRDIATAVDTSLVKIRKMPGISKAHRRELSLLQRLVTDLRQILERHASYLVDVVTPDSRRRRSRQSFSARFDAGARLVSYAAEKQGTKIVNRIPEHLRSPPMFPAELTTIFSNLLTNAVKAAGTKGIIRASAKRGAGRSITLRIDNTGARVKLSEAERWFRPFESTTTDLDAVLGQGMGLGLPITRSMLEEYGATIKFVPPASGFATAIEITIPEQ